MPERISDKPIIPRIRPPGATEESGTKGAMAVVTIFNDFAERRISTKFFDGI